MSSVYNYIQTFFLNKDRVNSAPEVLATSVKLFFRAKPDLSRSLSGASRPGVNIWICDIRDGNPIVKVIMKNSVTYLDYDEINTSGNATAATIFSFEDPVILKTGRWYGIVVKFQDPAYELWTNKKNNALVVGGSLTNTPSPGSSISKMDGLLYTPTSTNEFVKLTDRDLKFDFNIAKFKSTQTSITMVPRNYEFFTLSNRTGIFKGGELVWQDCSTQTGTVSVQSDSTTMTGSGTTFTNLKGKDWLVVGNSGLVQVKNITNATSLEMETRPDFTISGATFKVPVHGRICFQNLPEKKMYLVASSATNSTFKFTANDSFIYGERSSAQAKIASIDRFEVDKFEPRFSIKGSTITKINTSYKIANSSNAITSTWENIELYKNNKPKQKSYILSRSQEVTESSLYGDSKKSLAVKATMNVTVSNTNLYTAPYIDGTELDFFVYMFDVNNSSTTTKNGIANYDTEIDRNGLARSKYISKKISFAENKYAEDIVVYLSAFRPANTDIKVYAKIHNNSDAEAFDDKPWTPLVIKDNSSLYSRPYDEKDIVEYTYGFPLYPDVYLSNVNNVTLTIDRANNTIATSTDISANVVAGDLVRLYDPLIPENHEVFMVLASNSTSITLNNLVENLNIPTNIAQIDKLKYPTIAFNNIASDNVVRYYTSLQQEFDGYNSMQIKIVLFADSSELVPKVEQLQVIGVSA